MNAFVHIYLEWSLRYLQITVFCRKTKKVPSRSKPKWTPLLWTHITIGKKVCQVPNWKFFKMLRTGGVDKIKQRVIIAPATARVLTAHEPSMPFCFYRNEILKRICDEKPKQALMRRITWSVFPKSMKFSCRWRQPFRCSFWLNLAKSVTVE